jgi:hypothetical protein
LTTAPEVHGAQSPTKTGMPNNFCFIKFSPSQTVEAAEESQTLFKAPKPGGIGLQPSYEPFPH